jgi:hypothetical protein
MNQVVSVLEEREVEGREGFRCCCKNADHTAVAVARNSRLLAIMHIYDQLVSRHLIIALKMWISIRFSKT